MMRAGQIVDNIMKFIWLVGLAFLCLNCTQKKEEINLESEKTIVFHLKKNDSTSYRIFGDSAYYIEPLVFKPNLSKRRLKMNYKDIEDKLISGDSFWNKWWENRDVEYKFYLFITDGKEGKEDLIPLKDKFYGTVELDSVDY